EYFSSDRGQDPISKRIEKRIRHDFNSPVKKSIDPNDLGAKWTGDFYFESGSYKFSINSNKPILLKIDNEVVLDSEESSDDANLTVNQQLDGVHRIVVEYNMNNSTTDNTTDNSTTDNTTDNSTTDNTTDNSTPTDPVVEIDNSTPTVEVDWEDVTADSYIDENSGTIVYDKLQKLMSRPEKVIYLDDVTYVESKQVIIPSGKTVIGSSNGKTIIKSASSFHFTKYTNNWEFDKFLLRVKNGTGVTIKGIHIDGDTKKLWGGILVDNSEKTRIIEVDINAVWLSGIWISKSSEIEINSCNLYDCGGVPGNWATGMIELQDVDGVNIDGVKFKDTMSIGCGGIKAKAASIPGVRLLKNVTIQNCRFELFKYHGWVGDTKSSNLIGNYAIELSKCNVKNIQILNNWMNTTISIAQDHNADDTNNKLLIKGNVIIPEYPVSNILETSISGLIFEDNYVKGGNFIFVNYMNKITDSNILASINNYKKLTIRNNVFYAPNNKPSSFLRMTLNYSDVYIENNTIYTDRGYSNLLNFTPDVCKAKNIFFRKNLVINKGQDISVVVGSKYSNLEYKDNKFYGTYKGVNQNVNSIPVGNSGNKISEFFKTKIDGYGADLSMTGTK
ncbi:MAG: right-handed parallel beta-helix repeat-containing protein, partial [Cytophagales bacterium]|nr:right-handed parallel beta-helix repeat-containing protein [Cytophagales bacterium]